MASMICVSREHAAPLCRGYLIKDVENHAGHRLVAEPAGRGHRFRLQPPPSPQQGSEFLPNFKLHKSFVRGQLRYYAWSLKHTSHQLSGAPSPVWRAGWDLRETSREPRLALRHCCCGRDGFALRFAHVGVAPVFPCLLACLLGETRCLFPLLHC